MKTFIVGAVIITLLGVLSAVPLVYFITLETYVGIALSLFVGVPIFLLTHYFLYNQVGAYER